MQPVTGATLVNLELRRGLVASLKSKMIGYKTSEVEELRVPLLGKLLAKRSELLMCEQDTSSINDLIESLLNPFVPPRLSILGESGHTIPEHSKV